MQTCRGMHTDTCAHTDTCPPAEDTHMQTRACVQEERAAPFGPSCGKGRAGARAQSAPGKAPNPATSHLSPASPHPSHLLLQESQAQALLPLVAEKSCPRVQTTAPAAKSRTSHPAKGTKLHGAISPSAGERQGPTGDVAGAVVPLPPAVASPAPQRRELTVLPALHTARSGGSKDDGQPSGRHTVDIVAMWTQL